MIKVTSLLQFRESESSILICRPPAIPCEGAEVVEGAWVIVSLVELIYQAESFRHALTPCELAHDEFVRAQILPRHSPLELVSG